MNTIDIRSVSKQFKDKLALDDFSLTIKEGELVALLGVNGAGKTTLLRILACLIKPTSGDADICGCSILKQRDEVKKVINISPQETSVALNLTVKENLVFIAEIYGAKRVVAQAKADEMIESFNLKEVENKRAKVLSGGYARRLSIAMALITEPKVIFLDEPTLGLDIISRRELWESIEKLKGKVTIILTTHYMEEAESLADRIAIMVDGKLKEVGTSEELIMRAGTEKFEDAFVKIVKESVI